MRIATLGYLPPPGVAGSDTLKRNLEMYPARHGLILFSEHDYGPGVYWQGWFSAPDFPHNLPDVWRRHWAYLEESDTAPVLLGEFGGRSVALPHGPLVMRTGPRTADDPPTLTRAQVEEYGRRVDQLTREAERAYGELRRLRMAILDPGATLERLREMADPPGNGRS